MARDLDPYWLRGRFPTACHSQGSVGDSPLVQCLAFERNADTPSEPTLLKSKTDVTLTCLENGNRWLRPGCTFPAHPVAELSLSVHFTYVSNHLLRRE